MGTIYEWLFLRNTDIYNYLQQIKFRFSFSIVAENLIPMCLLPDTVEYLHPPSIKNKFTTQGREGIIQNATNNNSCVFYSPHPTSFAGPFHITFIITTCSRTAVWSIPIIQGSNTFNIWGISDVLCYLGKTFKVESNYIVYSTRHAYGIDMANLVEKMQQKSRR